MQLSVPDCRQVLIHGAADDVVPVEFSRLYCERKKSHGEEVRFVEIAAADHLALIDPRSAAWATVETAITELTHSPPRTRRNTKDG
jgi:pimeloyl-ACP methyl ester carboxylesterase